MDARDRPAGEVPVRTLLSLDVSGAWLLGGDDRDYHGFMVGLTVLGVRVEVWLGAREPR